MREDQLTQYRHELRALSSIWPVGGNEWFQARAVLDSEVNTVQEGRLVPRTNEMPWTRLGNNRRAFLDEI